MKRRDNILMMMLSSLFGAFVALLGYNYFAPPSMIIRQAADERNPLALTNYVFDSSNFIVPEGLNFVFAAKEATPSVVHVKTTYSVNVTPRDPFNDFFRDHFGDRFNRREREPRGAGSGVIISSDGYIVTNNHVIDKASNIEVILNDNRSYEAEVVGKDESTDLAVLKIHEKGLQPVPYGSSEDIQVGEWVLAIGNPYEFTSTVTAGIISAKARNIRILRSRDRIESFIQTDAAVNPGNSGGALVNLNGELIGINTAIASPSGAFAGYSFAVPSTLVQKVVNDLVAHGTVQRALLGIRIVDVDARLAENEKLGVVKGVYVVEVGDHSAADLAGIEKGDVIVSIDDVTIDNVAELQEQVAVNRPGERVDVTFIRGGKKRRVTATLRNSMGTTEIVAAREEYTFEGAVFQNATQEILDRLDLSGGVQIAEIRGGKWSNIRLKEGFIIIKIDDRSIRKLEDLIEAFESLKGNDGVLIEGVYPNGEKAYYGMVL